MASEARQEVCGAPWCRRMIKSNGHKPRIVNGTRICDACYYYVSEYVNRRSVSLKDCDLNRVKTPERDQKSGNLLKIHTCVMPWCKRSIRPNRKYPIDDAGKLYVCGMCRAHLKRIGSRPPYQAIRWQQIGLMALNGSGVPKPGQPEHCAMPWCVRVETPKGRGPNQEPLCNADHVYLRNYAQRHRLSVEEAFYRAKAPSGERPPVRISKKSREA